MFLAWNEIKHSKLRYFLIIGVMALIAYLVFFLVGLAYGLSQDNRTAVDKWRADAIILTDESNINVNMSMMDEDSANAVTADETAILGQTPSVAQINNRSDAQEKVNVSIFGVEADSFIAPNIIEGQSFEGNYEVIADKSLQLENGAKLDDLLYLAGVDKPVRIVGFTEDAKYNVSPVIYTNIDTFQEIKFSKTARSQKNIINAIVVQTKNQNVDDILLTDATLRVYPINTYIKEIPGYNAQNLTFGLMIAFLIIIASVVIGIFIYVFTLQKSAIFGVMKAQGISNKYISLAVLNQTLLLSVSGVAFGILLTLLTAFFLPKSVPFRIEALYFLTLFVILIVSAILGALFSVRAVIKVDPLKAIS